MQGTVVMLMALSGLGCHNKSCDVVYARPFTVVSAAAATRMFIRPTMYRRHATQGVTRAATAGAIPDPAIAAATRGATAGIMAVGFFPSFLAASSTPAAMAVADAMVAAMVATAACTVAIRATMHRMPLRSSAMHFSTITGQWMLTRPQRA